MAFHLTYIKRGNLIYKNFLLSDIELHMLNYMKRIELWVKLIKCKCIQLRYTQYMQIQYVQSSMSNYQQECNRFQKFIVWFWAVHWIQILFKTIICFTQITFVEYCVKIYIFYVIFYIIKYFVPVYIVWWNVCHLSL